MNSWKKCWTIANIARRPGIARAAWGSASASTSPSLVQKFLPLGARKMDLNRVRKFHSWTCLHKNETDKRIYDAPKVELGSGVDHEFDHEFGAQVEPETEPEIDGDPEHHFAFSDNYSEAVLGGEISATIFDNTGKVVHVAHKMTKYEFLLEHGLYPRDLRNIDPSPVSIIPSILARGRKGAGRCILVNLMHIKALILHDKVLIFDTHTKSRSDTHRLSMFLYELENKLKGCSPQDTALPFELRVLEAILVNVTTALDHELQVHLKTLNEILVGLEDHVDREQLKELLIGNKSVSRFHQRAVLIRDVLEELLESDDDMQQLYLGEQHSDESLAEVELLIESYCKQADEIVEQASNVRSHIKSTEEIVNIIVDANRNALMLLELKVTIVTVGFAVGAFVAALYGMNLENFIEESNEGMPLVVGFAVLGALAVTWFNLTKLHRTQKVGMFSSRGGGNGGGGSKSFVTQWLLTLFRRRRRPKPKQWFDHLNMSRRDKKGKKSNIMHQLTKMTGRRK